MIKNISIKKLITSKICHKLTFVQCAIYGVNYLFSPSFCPTSLIELSRVFSFAVFVIVLLFVRPTKCLKVLCSVFIILGFVIGFYYYAIILDSKAIKFDLHIYIKGDQLIEEAKKTLEENPEVTEKRYFIVGWLYFSFVGFMGFGLFGGLEIVKRSQLQSVSVDTAKNKKTSKKKR